MRGYGKRRRGFLLKAGEGNSEEANATSALLKGGEQNAEQGKDADSDDAGDDEEDEDADEDADGEGEDDDASADEDEEQEEDEEAEKEEDEQGDSDSEDEVSDDDDDDDFDETAFADLLAELDDNDEDDFGDEAESEAAVRVGEKQSGTPLDGGADENAPCNKGVSSKKAVKTTGGKAISRTSESSKLGTAPSRASRRLAAK